MEGNIFLESLGQELTDSEFFKRLHQRPIGFDRPPPDTLGGRNRLIESIRYDWFLPDVPHLELYRNLYSVMYEGYLRRPESRFLEIISNTRDWLDNYKHRSFAPRPLFKQPVNSFSFLGSPGMGKSTSLDRIFETFFQRVIKQETSRSVMIQITYLIVNCSALNSVKALITNCFTEFDAVLGRYYAENGIRYTNTLTDQYLSSNCSAERLMPQLANVAALHQLGVLVIDEINNLTCSGREYQKVVNFLKNLTAAIGLPIVITGTQEAAKKLAFNMQLGRRAQGVGMAEWERYDINDEKRPEKKKYWDRFIRALWEFQIISPKQQLTEEIKNKYFELTAGQLDMCVHLHVKVQKLAADKIDMLRSLNQVPGGNIITPDFIEKIRDNNFPITKPIVQAIRSKDFSVMEQYEDIREGYPTLLRSIANKMSLEGIKEAIKNVKMTKEEAEVLLQLLKGNFHEQPDNGKTNGLDGVPDSNDVSSASTEANVNESSKSKPTITQRETSKRLPKVEGIDAKKVLDEQGKSGSLSDILDKI